MRRIKQFMLVVLAAFTMVQGAMAQDYTGTTIGDAAGKGVYLYNVGTKQWLTSGNSWGTQASLGKIAMKFTLSGSGYKLLSPINSGYLTFIVKNKYSPEYDYGKFYVDKAASFAQNFTFEEITNFDSANPTYKIKFNVPVADSTIAIPTGDYYAVAPTSGTGLTYATSADDEYGQWKIVTEAQITAAYQADAINATNAKPAIATQFIKDPDFRRNNNAEITNWFIEEAATTNLQNGAMKGTTKLTDDNHLPKDAVNLPETTTYTYTLTANYDITYGLGSYYTYQDQTSTVGTSYTTTTAINGHGTAGNESLGTTLDDAIREAMANNMPAAINEGDSYNDYYTITSATLTGYTLTTTLGTTGGRAYTYYVGNGYVDNAVVPPSSNDVPILFEGEDENLKNDGTAYDAGTKYQWIYGGDWTGNIHGDGQVSQPIDIASTTKEKGWYKVSCDGFTTTKEGKTVLFAQTTTTATDVDVDATDLYQEVALNQATAPTTYVKASKLLAAGGYDKYVIVYVPEGSTLTFGIKANGTSADDSAWACFDNFQLEYLGGSYEDVLVLSELQTSTDYITKQVDASKTYTLRLERSLKKGQWNSIVLPVALTASQVKGAFGSGTKISKLIGVKNESTITFQLVPLTDDNATVMEAYTPYIIKPSEDPDHGNGNDTYYWKDRTSGTQNSITFKNKHYVIGQALLDEAPKAKTVTQQIDNTGATIGTPLKFIGTLVDLPKADGKVTAANICVPGTTDSSPMKAYLVATDGNWYSPTSNYRVKGFRAWMQVDDFTKVTTSNLTFNLNGVAENGTTDIQNIFGEPADKAGVRGIYTLGGQKVREGSSMENLPKGIYIVNGKKYVVK